MTSDRAKLLCLFGAHVPAARPKGTATVIVSDTSGTAIASTLEQLFRTVAARQATRRARRPPSCRRSRRVTGDGHVTKDEQPAATVRRLAIPGTTVKV